MRSQNKNEVVLENTIRMKAVNREFSNISHGFLVQRVYSNSISLAFSMLNDASTVGFTLNSPVFLCG